MEPFGNVPPQAPAFAPPPRRNPLLLPLIVAAVLTTAVVLAGAVLFAVWWRGDSPPLPGLSAGSCVVGSWAADTTRSVVSQQINGATVAVEFTGRGTRIRLDAEGNGITDYGSGVTLSAPGYADQVLAGTIRYRYAVSRGRMTFSDIVTNGTVTQRDVFGTVYSERMDPIVDPVEFRCGDKQLALFNSRYSYDLRAA